MSQSAISSVPWTSSGVVRAFSVDFRVTASSQWDSPARFTTSEGRELPLFGLKAGSSPLALRFPGTESSEVVEIVCRNTRPSPTADSSPCPMISSAGWPSLLIGCCLYFLCLFRILRFAGLACSRFATVLGSWILRAFETFDSSTLTFGRISSVVSRLF